MTGFSCEERISRSEKRKTEELKKRKEKYEMIVKELLNVG